MSVSAKSVRCVVLADMCFVNQVSDRWTVTMFKDGTFMHQAQSSRGCVPALFKSEEAAKAWIRRLNEECAIKVVLEASLDV